jgi:hypothetical protein
VIPIVPATPSTSHAMHRRHTQLAHDCTLFQSILDSGTTIPNGILIAELSCFFVNERFAILNERTQFDRFGLERAILVDILRSR